MSDQVVTTAISALIAIVGISAGVLAPMLQRNSDKSQVRRRERLDAYFEFLLHLQNSELALGRLGRRDLDDVAYRETVEELREALSAAHLANIKLYVVAPYLLAHTGELVIREIEGRFDPQLAGQSPRELDARYWDSLVDQIRDDLGTVSQIPTADQLRTAGYAAGRSSSSDAT